MSFKLSLMILLVAIASAMTMGCSRESEPTRQPFKVTFGEKSTCFKDIPQTFQRYFDGESTNAEIHGFWTCAQSAFQLFDDVVKGRNEDSFDPAELNYFLRDFFLKGEPLPSGLMQSIMEIKVAWFGGSPSVLTREELRQFQIWFQTFDEVMIMIRPHVDVLTNSKRKISYQELLNAEQAVVSGAFKIGSLPLSRGKAITVSQIKNFLNELQSYVKKGISISEEKKWGSVLPFIMATKNLMFGTPEDMMLAADWKNLMSVGAQGLMILNHANHGVIKSNIEDPHWVEAVDHIFAQANNLVTPVFERRKSQPISEAEWKYLFDQLGKSNLVGLKPNEMMQIYLTLHPLIKAPTTKDNDLHQEDFFSLLNELAVWKSVHNKILGGLPLDPSREYQAYLADLETKNQELQLDKNGEWLIPAPSKNLDVRSRLHLNWKAFIFRKLQMKYGDSKGWTLDQLKPLQQSLSSLFEEKYLTKVFREANLFTLAGDGNDILSPSEAIQYLSLVMSGMLSSSRIQDFAKVEQDPKENSLNVVHIEKTVWKNKADLFQHLPNFLNYLSDEPTWKKINQLLMKTVKEQASLTSPWTSWELSQSQVLTLYLEGFMKRFDKNKDQVIDLDEARDALKVFAPTLGPLVSKIGVDESELESFFLFMIRYGDTPFTLYGGDVLYTHWKWNPQTWVTINADRKTLLSILATLSTL